MSPELTSSTGALNCRGSPHHHLGRVGIFMTAWWHGKYSGIGSSKSATNIAGKTKPLAAMIGWRMQVTPNFWGFFIFEL